MQLKIIQEKDSKLLERKELELDAFFEKGTPSNAEIKKGLSSSLKKPEELIVIKKIDQHYGVSKAHVFVYVYNDIEQLKKIEHIKEKKKEEGKKESPTQPAAETKKEEPKEEKKSEGGRKAEEKPAEEKE